MSEQDSQSEDVPWEQYGDVEREDTESKGLIGRSRADKIGWIGFALVAVPVLVLGFLPPAVEEVGGLVGVAIGGGAFAYLLFYGGAKAVGKVRS